MAKVGRPSIINRAVIEKISNAIRAGNYIETAASYSGISKSTFYEWLKRGEREKRRIEADPRLRVKKEEALYVELSDAVEKALAEGEMRDVLTISKAAEEGIWQAAAWRLERKFPNKWGRKERVTIDASEQAMDKLDTLLEGIDEISKK